MAPPEVGIGIAGYGMMGKAHSYAYTVAPVMRSLPCRPRLRVISMGNAYFRCFGNIKTFYFP